MKGVASIALHYAWRLWARPDQLAPPGAWRTWVLLGGRGAGKSRAAAEWIHEEAAAGAGRMALIARTAGDLRDVMVEGASGILATAPPTRRPTWNPSNRRLTWPNGAIATTFSAEEPDSLRGPNFDLAWCDELASWPRAQETWDTLQMALRLGANPRAAVTTTPRPTPLIRGLVADPSSRVARASTFANAANLAPSFLDQLRLKYDGTRLGRQELMAEILDDNPGGIFSRADIEKHRVANAPEMKRVIVAVDPSATNSATSCECGIIVAGVGVDGHGYILADLSTVASPNEWGAIVVKAYRDWKADRVVAEINMGGALVEMLLRTIDRNIPYRAVRASRGKAVRAEPVAALLEQGRWHIVGELPGLEDQLVSWDPSPPTSHSRAGTVEADRVDAVVWAISELMVEGVPDSLPMNLRAFSAPFAPGGDTRNPFAPTRNPFAPSGQEITWRR